MCWDATTVVPADLTTPGRLRRFVRDQITRATGQGPESPALRDAELVVSELVTNAVTTGTTDVALSLHVHRREITIEVSDDAPGRPHLVDADSSNPHGRGLRIVESVASGWGIRVNNRGKTVWADIPTVETAESHLICLR